MGNWPKTVSCHQTFFEQLMITRLISLYHATVPSDSIWQPRIELTNMDEMKNFGIELMRDAMITSTGQVTWRRIFRATTTCNVKIENYPFDIQDCPFVLSSRNYPATWVALSVAGWNKVNEIDTNLTVTEYDSGKMEVIKHREFAANNEWKFLNYK